MKTVYGCVLVRQFAAQAVLRGRRDATERAVAVMEGAAPLERVCAMNARAQALGVQAGMTRLEVETFGCVEAWSRSQEQERMARAALRVCVGAFSPVFEERGDGADWECVVDLSGTERLLGAPAVVGKHLLEAVAALGFRGRVVVCGNVDAGFSLGRVGDGVQVVEDGGLAAALASLPVGVLQLEEEQAERFGVWGVATLGELAALPEVKLIARMGQAGKQLRLRARGELPHQLKPTEEMLRLEETVEFEEPVETLETLMFCMNGMLERILLRATERTFALASVTVMLWLEPCRDRVIGRPEPAFGGPVACLERSSAPDECACLLEQKTPDSSRRLNGSSQLSGAEVPESALPLSEARFGMASADAAVRKAWHRASLLGQALAKDVPPVRGEIAARRGLCIGDGQAMQRSRSGLTLVPKREPSSCVLIASTQGEKEPVVLETIPEFSKKEEVDETKWGSAFQRTIRPSITTTDRRLLLKMLQLDLEAHSPEGIVVRMRLVGEAGEASRIQLGMFAPPMPEPTRFEDTHARLVSLAGEKNVGRVKALDTHASECFLLEQFVLPQGFQKAPMINAQLVTPAMCLRKMRPPAAIYVTEHAFEISKFWLEGMCYDVDLNFGPWRGSGSWWGSKIWSIDIWDIAGRGEDGELLLCVMGRDLLRERWVVEGIYD